VVDKAVAMTYKWCATDESIGAAGHRKKTGAGGSKGILLYGEGEDAKEKGLRVYAEVLSLIGLTLTGSDEGGDPASADLWAELAPLNVYGSDKSAYKGRKPTRYTADGTFEGLKTILSLRAKNWERRYPVLAIGYGGIGEPLVTNLMKENITIAG